MDATVEVRLDDARGWSNVRDVFVMGNRCRMAFDPIVSYGISKTPINGISADVGGIASTYL